MRNFILTFLLFISLVIGVLSRDYVNIWLESIIGLSILEQFIAVFMMCFRLVCIYLAIVSAVLLLYMCTYFMLAIWEELKYQFMQRKVLHIMVKQNTQDKRELSPREQAERLERERLLKEAEEFANRVQM